MTGNKIQSIHNVSLSFVLQMKKADCINPLNLLKNNNEIKEDLVVWNLVINFSLKLSHINAFNILRNSVKSIIIQFC